MQAPEDGDGGRGEAGARRWKLISESWNADWETSGLVCQSEARWERQDRLLGSPEAEHPRHVCTRIHMHAFIHVHTHPPRYSHVPMGTPADTHKHACTLTRTLIGKHTNTCPHTRTGKHTHVCMHAHIPVKPLTHQPGLQLPGSLQGRGEELLGAQEPPAKALTTPWGKGQAESRHSGPGSVIWTWETSILEGEVSGSRGPSQGQWAQSL